MAASETFDAGTVYAQALLDRDQIQRDIRELRRDLADFERGIYKPKVRLEKQQAKEDLRQFEADLKRTATQGATAKVDVDTTTGDRKVSTFRRNMLILGALVAAPFILVRATRALARVAQVRQALLGLPNRVVNLGIEARAIQQMAQIADHAVSARNALKAIGPALLPLIGLATGGLLALSGSLIGAAGAAGIFAIAAIPALTTVVERSKDIEEAQKKVTEAITAEERATALAELNALLAATSAEQQRAIQDINAIKGAWRDFQTAIQPAVFSVLAASVGVITTALPLLVPVVNRVSNVMVEWLERMEQSLQSGTLRLFIAWLGDTGVDSLALWGISFGRAFGGMVHLLRASTPLINDFNIGLAEMTARFERWAAGLGTNQQFLEFMDFVRVAGPDLLTILGLLVSILWSVQMALSPVTIAVLDFIAGFLEAHPTLAKFMILGWLVMTMISGLLLFIGGLVLKMLILAVILGRGAQAMMFARQAALFLSLAMKGQLLAALVGPGKQMALLLWRMSGFARIAKLITILTRSWAIAQWALNAAWLANPVVLIIAAIVAGIALLVAGIVYAWNHFEWFRNAVMTVWNAIKIGAEAVGTAAMWLWTNILGPVFGFIAQAAQVLIAIIFTVLVTPFLLAWKLIEWGAKGAWANFKPIFEGIGWLAMWLWNNAIRPAFEGIAWLATWLWHNVLSPIWELMKFGWTLLGQMIMFVLNAYIKPAWDLMMTVLGILGQFFVSVLQNVIKPAWDALGTGIRWVIDHFIMPGWNLLQAGLDWLGQKFDQVVGWIGTIWNKLRGHLAKPVNFLINTVWNQGVVRAWNMVAGLLPGIDPIQPLAPIPEMKRGGPVKGGRRGFDSVLTWLMPGEWVAPVELVQEIGIRNLERARHNALGGRAGEDIPRQDHFRALQSGLLVEGADHNTGGYSTVGFGGVKPHVAQAGHFLKQKFGIGTVGGVGQRPNASDHPKGLALDFMTFRDLAKGDRLVDYATQHAAHLAIKYIIWRQRINEGSGWKGMADRGSATANHFDHPHISFLGGAGGGRDFAGGGLNPLPGLIRGFFDQFVNPAIARMPQPPPRWMGVPRGAATMVRDKALEWFLSMASFDDGGRLAPGFTAAFNGTGQHEYVARGDQLMGLIQTARLDERGRSGADPDLVSVLHRLADREPSGDTWNVTPPAGASVTEFIAEARHVWTHARRSRRGVHAR